MPDTLATPDQPMSVADFAATVKAKYPVYQNRDDNELVKAIVAKYPAYQSKVRFDTPPPPLSSVEQQDIENKGGGFTQSLAEQTTGTKGLSDFGDTLQRIGDNPIAAVKSFASRAAQGMRSSIQRGVSEFKGGQKWLGAADIASAISPPLAGIARAATQAGAGNPKGAAGTTFGVGLQTALLAKGPPEAARAGAEAEAVPARVTTPAQTEALTAVLDTEGGKTNPYTEVAEPALPELRNAAAKLKITPDAFKGRAGNQLALKIADESIKAHNAEMAQITLPFRDQLVSTQPLADAIKAKITPELTMHEPEVATRLGKEALKYSDRAIPLKDLNDLRIRLNKENTAYYNKSTASQITTDVEAQAQVAALNAARTVQYQALENLGHLPQDYVRGLMQREGAVIEARNAIARSVNQASGAQGEAVSQSLREKVTKTYPSRRGVERSIVKNLFGLKPVEELNTRFRQAFSDLGPHQPASPPISTARVAAGAASSVSSFRNPTDVMLAAKSGRITPAEAARITQRMAGKSNVVRPLPPPP